MRQELSDIDPNELRNPMEDSINLEEGKPKMKLVMVSGSRLKIQLTTPR